MNKGFRKGKSGNPEGRPSGTPNKVTADIREAYRQLVENNLENLQKWIDEVSMKDPARALAIIIEISEYIIPKLSRSDIAATLQRDDNPDGFKIVIEELPTEELIRRAEALKKLEDAGENESKKY